MADPVITSLAGSGASTRWILMNPHVTPTCISVGVVVSGSAQYTVAYTYDDPNQTMGPSSANPPVSWPLSALSGQSTTKDLGVTNNSNITGPIMGLQATINSGTGSITMYVLQAGIRQS